MKRLVLAVMTLSMTGTRMNTPLHGQTQTAPVSTKKPIVFACDMKAMTQAQRKRHSEILSPALKSAKLTTSERRMSTHSNSHLTQRPLPRYRWIRNERLCCPFFEFDIHVGDNSAPMVLRITGPEGVKQFIKAELSGMVG